MKKDKDGDNDDLDDAIQGSKSINHQNVILNGKNAQVIQKTTFRSPHNYDPIAFLIWSLFYL